MIGVLMMVRNGEKYLRTALRSLKEQSVNWKLFVTDDASTDSTPEILSNFFEIHRGKVVVDRFENHAGCAKAFNNSLKLALSDRDVEYIIKLDADDYFLPGALKNLASHIEETGVDIVYADHISLEEKGDSWEVTGRSRSPLPDEISAGRLLRCLNVISGGSVLARKEVYEEIGGWDETLEGGWDVEWYIRCLLAGKRFAKLDEPVYVRRFHRESSYAESTEGELHEQRWLRWRKQLWERREEYRRIALERLLC